MTSLRARASSVAQPVLQRPLVARHLRAYARADGLRFMRWAAAIALFGYLSLFPLLVLAFIALGVSLENYPQLRSDVDSFLSETMPLLFDPQDGQQPVDIQQVAEATAAAGVVAVVALLFTGLGWIDASIEGVRRMQGAMHRGGNLVVAKVRDLAFLFGLGVVLLIALIGSIGVQVLSDDALSRMGMDGDRAWLVEIGGLLVAGLLLWVALVSLYASAWWRRPQRSWTAIMIGALQASLVLVVLLQLVFLVVGRTLANPVYGTLAIAAALLVFLYMAFAVTLYFAAWVSVREGVPRTQEEVAYASRAKGGDITLPAEIP